MLHNHKIYSQGDHKITVKESSSHPEEDCSQNSEG